MAAEGAVNARILYWGVEQAGKSANLRFIHAKLRPDHRGELREVPTRIDPTVSYEVLPIELGEVAGTKTCLEAVSVPGGPEHAPTRKQLLDRVNGVVLVIDSRREQLEANLESVEELRKSLSAYGQSLEGLPVVVQYNKRDLGDPYAVEELHRKLGLPRAPVFEAVASDGTGVLATLTTISKSVIRVLREGGVGALPPLPEGPAPAARAPVAPKPTPPPAATPPSAPVESPTSLDAPVPDLDERPSRELLEQAMLAEEDDPEVERQAADLAMRTQIVLETPPAPAPEPAAPAALRLDAALEIAEVGSARVVGPRSVRLPLTLADADGTRVRIALTVQLDALPDDEPA